MKTDLDFSFDRPIYGKELFQSTGQLSRAAWLAKKVREDDVYFMQDGTLSQLLFKELLNSFLNGQDIAAIVIGFSLIERTIAGRLFYNNEKSAANGTSQALITSALEREWITGDEYSLLDKLRELRNPLVHFKPHLHQTRPEVKAALNGRSPEQEFEQDAFSIIEAVIHVLNKTAL